MITCASLFERPTWDWDASPSLLVYGPVAGLAERRWATWPGRPPPERLVEATLTEERLRELAGMPRRTVAGTRYVFALFGLERAKPAARRMLAGFLDGGRTAVLFAHSLVGLDAVASRCAFVRAPARALDDAADDADADIRALARLDVADRSACGEVLALARGPGGPGAARARLTKLFQSGVTLAQFFRETLAAHAHVPPRRLANLTRHAAALEHRAGFNTVVHAEALLGELLLTTDAPPRT